MQLQQDELVLDDKKEQLARSVVYFDARVCRVEPPTPVGSVGRLGT